MNTTLSTKSSAPGADQVFRALSSAQRRELLRLIGERTPEAGKTCCMAEEVCACKLSDALGLSPSTISHHMKVLVEAGLVSARKDGLWVYYKLRREALRAAAEELAGF